MVWGTGLLLEVRVKKEKKKMGSGLREGSKVLLEDSRVANVLLLSKDKRDALLEFNTPISRHGEVLCVDEIISMGVLTSD